MYNFLESLSCAVTFFHCKGRDNSIEDHFSRKSIRYLELYDASLDISIKIFQFKNFHFHNWDGLPRFKTQLHYFEERNHFLIMSF